MRSLYTSVVLIANEILSARTRQGDRFSRVFRHYSLSILSSILPALGVTTLGPSVTARFRQNDAMGT